MLSFIKITPLMATPIKASGLLTAMVMKTFSTVTPTAATIKFKPRAFDTVKTSATFPKNKSNFYFKNRYRKPGKELFQLQNKLQVLRDTVKYFMKKSNRAKVEPDVMTVELANVTQELNQLLKTYYQARLERRVFLTRYANKYKPWLTFLVKKYNTLSKLPQFRAINSLPAVMKSWYILVRHYRYIKHFYPQNTFNFDINLLRYEANQKVGRFTAGVGLRQFYNKRFFLQRQNLDNTMKGVMEANKDFFYKKKFQFKNYFWMRKSALERRKSNYILSNYRYLRGYQTYINVQKKNKMHYNWADKHFWKRFPVQRYKYNILYKFPRFADYRRLFKHQLREQHLFRWVYRLKFSQLIKAFRKATYNTKRSFELMFVKHFEFRLDTIVYRLNFANSLKHARQLVNRGLFVVNNKVVDNFRYHVNLGDVVMPVLRLRATYGPGYKRFMHIKDYGVTLSSLRLFWRPIQADQYPDYVMLNERIPAGMIISNVNPNKLRYNKPFSIQFLTLSLLKYT